MGWFGRKRTEDEQPADKSAERSLPQKEESNEATKIERPENSGNEPDSDESAANTADMPIPAIFEFGGSAVASGIQMKGICAVDEPDQIQACLWRVDPVPPDAPKEESKYQILF